MGVVLALLVWPVGLVVSIIAWTRAVRAKRPPTLGVVGTILATALALVSLVFGLAFLAAHDSGPSTGSAPAASSPGGVDGEAGTGALAGALPRDGVRLLPEGGSGAGAASGVPRVDLYVDYMCPVCGQFEEINGADVASLLDSGAAEVVLHPVAILDGSSRGTRYSTRAGNAVLTVADEDPTKTLLFSEALFAHQPREGSVGLTDDEIAALASGVGVPRQVVADFAERRFETWVDTATELAGADSELANPRFGGFGTPTIVLDGRRWDGNWSVPGELRRALQGAPQV